MRRKNKIITIITIVVDILTTITLILALALHKDIFYAIYWSLITIVLFNTVVHISLWSKIGKDIDKKDSKMIKRSYDDATAIIVVLNGLIYLAVMFLEMINVSIKSNPFIILIIYVLFVISHLMNFLTLYRANKETKILVEKTFNKKK